MWRNGLDLFKQENRMVLVLQHAFNEVYETVWSPGFSCQVEFTVIGNQIPTYGSSGSFAVIHLVIIPKDGRDTFTCIGSDCQWASWGILDSLRFLLRSNCSRVQGTVVVTSAAQSVWVRQAQPCSLPTEEVLPNSSSRVTWRNTKARKLCLQALL